MAGGDADRGRGAVHGHQQPEHHDRQDVHGHRAGAGHDAPLHRAGRRLGEPVDRLRPERRCADRGRLSRQSSDREVEADHPGPLDLDRGRAHRDPDDVAVARRQGHLDDI